MPSQYTDDQVQAQRVGYYLLRVNVENALLIGDPVDFLEPAVEVIQLYLVGPHTRCGFLSTLTT